MRPMPVCTSSITSTAPNAEVRARSACKKSRVPGTAPVPGAEGRTPTELDEYVDHRWWTVDEIAESRERFFPTPLPGLVREFLAGAEIDESFDLWN